MNVRSKMGSVGAGVALATLTILGLASAQTPGDNPSGDSPPRGPFVDFCPTAEQTEAHLIEYGFDYKPTVACTSEGEVQGSSSDAPADQSAQESDEAWMARDKAFLQSLKPGPDRDGDPSTIEGVAPDGAPVTIFIQGEPGWFGEMTPAEFAELMYP